MPTKQAKFPTHAVSLTKHPASLPEKHIPDDIDHAKVASASLRRLEDLRIEDLTDNAIWRDLLAFTGTLRTFFGPTLVNKVWLELSQKRQPGHLTIIPNSSRIVRLGTKVCWVEARFSFDVIGKLPARCSGSIGLVPDSASREEWKIWLLTTILEQPHGFPGVDDLRPATEAFKPALGTTDGTTDDLQSVDCIVVGASIAGLCMGARLHAMGLSYAVVEKQAEVGDNWLLDRYESLKLHTSKGYNQMPGEPRTFGPEDPYNLGMTDLAHGLRRFVTTFGINTMLSTTLQSGLYDEKTKRWTLELRRKGALVTLKAHHVVLAVGNMGVKPNMPHLPHRERFKGDVVHGIHWRNATPWRGKRGVCVGSANTAHGVIADMARADFESITMIQRSRTFLLPTSTFGALVDPVFNEETPVSDSDRMLLAYPLPVQRLMAMKGIEMCAEATPEYFDRIEAQGWDVERNGDLWGLMYDREGGHFFDLGSAELVANGTVKVRCDALPVAYTESGLEMSDGSYIDADVIVFATGYTANVRETANRLFGSAVGERLEDFWQCDEEGESRGAWKYTGHPGLWYTGHGFAHARYYSRFVAMHIKADTDGRPIETYTATPTP
ncbi:hypothetical protein LTR37_016366 [Vermiconidia calcicola]|uniref:Uncharacterized protein n=1 Tax=Vermiconidia calcicola TaxID=1690605 RepID=A0ACC3MN29_9PEZI|nr:hypothetical protein LTR37_016366 [Vermiconidia calcicola]